MAHTKAGGTTSLGRDSAAQRLGVKLSNGQTAIPGNIIIRQRGSKYVAGLGVRKGKDDTLYAVIEGKVQFKTQRKTKFDGNTRMIKIVSVVAA